ncbi:zinc finger protein ZPR1-like [Gigantopelta aegis]|uniref:zinc finger protein ZPR1-like n=1 Tax=Gigantopelta aegis TaxID=1735272 RepID=UPI001B88CCE4|nr:zinc finger protein ZPR1-like [Gigantopelta aegis]
MATSEKEKPFFQNINADDGPEVTEIESICVNCEEQGTTRLLFTKIPFFREVIVSSFSCDHCGYHNSSLQPGGSIQNKGVRYRIRIKNQEDLNRQVVQTPSATVLIPALEFEMPPNKGVLTTVEGIIDRAVDGLEQDQVLRKIQHPEVAAKIDEFVKRLKELKNVEQPFELIVDDPSGNSFIENPRAPNVDPELSVMHYMRSTEQNHELGLYTQAELQDDGTKKSEEENFTGEDEVMQFQSLCPNCKAQCETNMKIVDIPHFKKVVLMVTLCDECGYKESEVKGGTGIEPKGIKIDLHITNKRDMLRDVIKSESSKIIIPDLDFETGSGTLGGKFSTVEGLLIDIKTQLRDLNPFFHGDSSQPDLVTKLEIFCQKIDKIITGETLDIHFILDDPAGNSYIENPHVPDKDPELCVSHYERNFEQNEELGLNDMKTENYEDS